MKLYKQSLDDQEEALDMTSDPINIDQCVNGATDLRLNQRMQLRKVLIKNKQAINGSLGLIAGGDYHVNMKDDTPRCPQKKMFPCGQVSRKEI